MLTEFSPFPVRKVSMAGWPSPAALRATIRTSYRLDGSSSDRGRDFSLPGTRTVCQFPTTLPMSSTYRDIQHMHSQVMVLSYVVISCTQVYLSNLIYAQSLTLHTLHVKLNKEQWLLSYSPTLNHDKRSTHSTIPESASCVTFSWANMTNANAILKRTKAILLAKGAYYWRKHRLLKRKWPTSYQNALGWQVLLNCVSTGFTVNGTGRCYEYVLILKSNNYKSDLITSARGKEEGGARFSHSWRGNNSLHFVPHLRSISAKH